MPVAQDPGLRDSGEGTSISWQDAIVHHVLQKVAQSDAGEEQRRKSDRIGANLFYGRHWAVEIPRTRVQMVLNVSKALVEHCVSIMTKQQPAPIIEPGDVGDKKGADLMRKTILRWWDKDRGQLKLRRSCRIAKTTRTCAGKVVWDPTLHGGAGMMTWDIIPGWRLILDDQANFVRDMGYIGHRETMRRSLAARMYDKAVEEIYAGTKSIATRGTPAGTAMPGSPIGDPYKRTIGGSVNFGTIVNGSPVISAFTNQPARSNLAKDDTVQIIELLYKDDEMYEDVEREYDPDGKPRMEVVTGDDGMPMFEQLEDELVNVEGQLLSLPRFKLKMREIEHEVLKPKYPFWRRSTVLLPDNVLLDDRAWDGPANYALLSDGDCLEGPWVKGSELDLEDPQVAVNVSASLMMDNLRMNSMRPVIAGRDAQLERTSLLIGPGDVVQLGGKVDSVKPFEFPDVSQSWFSWLDHMVGMMERIIGAQGIMQGEAAGRVDSAAGYDMLAEIGGSRLVESTQRMEQFIADLIEIAGWFAQKYFTDKHAFNVEDADGNITDERVSVAGLIGTYEYKVQTGSTLAWSESAVRARLLQELQAGIIDKIAYWQRTDTPDWPQIKDRLLQQPPVLSGAAGAPPKRTRSSAKNAQKPAGQPA